MKKVAFYAPMKAPDHPVPSGDRLIARLLMQALEQAGFEVKLASRLRTRDGRGQPQWQQRIIALSKKIAQRLIRQWERQNYRPDAWFTYHLYYKAPDLIGPYIAQHYGIPYLVAEASWAGKRAQGDWQLFHQQLEHALLQASRIFTINPVDAKALQRFLPKQGRQGMVALRPFLDFSAISKQNAVEQLGVAQVALEQPSSIGRHVSPQVNPPLESFNASAACPRLITIAMMRPGDKLASYEILAAAVKQVTVPFQWFIVGDGSERSHIEALFADDARIQFCGRLDNAEVHALLAQCDLHVWPAVNEAFGMALLEAQYHGVAILSGDEGGVSSVMADGVSGELVTPRDPEALSVAIINLLADTVLLQRYQQQAQHYVKNHHDIQQAAAVLKRELNASITECR